VLNPRSRSLLREAGNGSMTRTGIVMTRTSKCMTKRLARRGVARNLIAQGRRGWRWR
jgi:hypothetical protein